MTKFFRSWRLCLHVGLRLGLLFPTSSGGFSGAPVLPPLGQYIGSGATALDSPWRKSRCIRPTHNCGRILAASSPWKKPRCIRSPLNSAFPRGIQRFHAASRCAALYPQICVASCGSALHPAARRCSSVKYCRYFPSSRLAQRAHRRSRCNAGFHHGLLVLRHLDHRCECRKSALICACLSAGRSCVSFGFGVRVRDRSDSLHRHRRILAEHPQPVIL